MGRLTERNENIVYIKKKLYESCESICLNEYDCNECPIQEILLKLAHYEDLEEQGRLIELPCAVGDTVYEIVLLPMLPEDGMKESYIIWEKELRLEDIEDFGKTVFLTKEEAEAKLTALRGE